MPPEERRCIVGRLQNRSECNLAKARTGSHGRGSDTDTKGRSRGSTGSHIDSAANHGAGHHTCSTPSGQCRAQAGGSGEAADRHTAAGKAIRVTLNRTRRKDGSGAGGSRESAACRGCSDNGAG